MIAPGVLETERLRRFADGAAQARGVGIETVLEEYRSQSPLGRLTTVEQVGWAVTQCWHPRPTRCMAQPSRWTAAPAEDSSSSP